GLPLTGLVSAQASALAIAVDGGLRFVRWKLAVTVLAVATTVGLGAVVGTPGEQPVAPPKSAPKSPETERAPSRKPTSVADAKPAGDTAKAADARSASDGAGAADAKPMSMSAAAQRYEEARIILADVGAGRIAASEEPARLREARGLLAKNL